MPKPNGKQLELYNWTWWIEEWTWERAHGGWRWRCIASEWGREKEVNLLVESSCFVISRRKLTFEDRALHKTTDINSFYWQPYTYLIFETTVHKQICLYKYTQYVSIVYVEANWKTCSTAFTFQLYMLTATTANGNFSHLEINNMVIWFPTFSFSGKDHHSSKVLESLEEFFNFPFHSREDTWDFSGREVGT